MIAVESQEERAESRSAVEEIFSTKGILSVENSSSATAAGDGVAVAQLEMGSIWREQESARAWRSCRRFYAVANKKRRSSRHTPSICRTAYAEGLILEKILPVKLNYDAQRSWNYLCTRRLHKTYQQSGSSSRPRKLRIERFSNGRERRRMGACRTSTSSRTRKFGRRCVLSADCARRKCAVIPRNSPSTIRFAFFSAPGSDICRRMCWC